MKRYRSCQISDEAHLVLEQSEQSQVKCQVVLSCSRLVLVSSRLLT